jgi:cytochrome o ubiquinol oxidase operon protein cyoD
MYHLNHNMMPGMSQDLIQEAVPGSMQNMQHNMPGMK